MDTSASADPLLIAAAGCTVCVLLTAAVPLVAGKTGRASFGFWISLLASPAPWRFCCSSRYSFELAASGPL